ncbi:MAG TPA: hypothetical protein VND99_05630 [Candidatus Acidoferrales bacterium]|nr:hypothetical protein [Candidatus Acidoferrales bacterium]
MKGSVTTIVISIVCIIAVLGMAAYIFIAGSQSKQSTPSTASASPSIAVPVKDFAPGMPMSQKTTILIQTSDSSDIKYIVPTDQANTYIKSLPEGYRVVSKTP